MFERLDAAFRLYWRRLHVVLLIAWTVWLPGNLIYHYVAVELLDGETSPWSLLLSAALVLVWDSLATAALYSVFGSALAGRPCGFRQAVRLGLSRWWLLAATRLVVQVLVSLGLMLLIVPGLVLLARWILAEAAAVFESSVPSEARRRSVELGEGHRIEMLLAWCLPLLAIWGLAWYGETLLAPMLAESWWLQAIYTTLWSPLETFAIAVLAVYYVELRQAAPPVAETVEEAA